nr:hypothetical protein [Variovorax sp. PBL-E5]
MVDFLLMSICLSHRDNADVVACFRGLDHLDRALQRAQRYESLFVVAEPPILERHGLPGFDHLLRVRQIEAVLREIGGSTHYIAIADMPERAAILHHT